ncbi:uncharacterized protein LOC124810867 [Hydra vulgaris]|uniref:uncharacterized protein LOC124810867 n=1 Tax=Hydra vulgaris TaxID=6087 RepID=UPI0032EA3D8F
MQNIEKFTSDDFLCHSQNVEKHLKLVTEAATTVSGEMRRDRYIRAKLLSRNNDIKYNLKLEVRTRSKNLYNYHLDSSNLPDIASKVHVKKVNVKPNSVGNIIRKYKKIGTIKNLPRKGRPAKTTLRIDREIIRKVEQDRGLSALKLAKDLQTDHDITVNPPTVRNSDQWRRVLWPDETKICLFGSDGRMMVWGSFAWSGVGELEFIDGIMTKEDGDPKHTSNLATQWLEKNIIKMLEWIPQSPYLNRIKIYLFKVIVADQKPSSLSQLKAILVKEWEKFDPQWLKNLVHSMPKKCLAVIKAKGTQIDY